MELWELNQAEYLQTMNGKMANITGSAQLVAVLWDYAALLLQNNLLSPYGYEKQLVEAVYANGDNTCHHVLLFGTRPNVYLVILVNTDSQAIIGHYVLDLNKEYGPDKGQ